MQATDIFPNEPTFEGLSSHQAAQLHAQGKGNLAPAGAGRTVGEILLANLLTWFNILNFILAAALLSVRSYRNLLFLGVVVFNTLIGTIQEIRAKRTVDRLTLLVAAPVQVLRDGVWQQLPSQQLVQDDVVRFGAGDQVCADGVVVAGQGAADEALLTGESDPANKQVGDELLSGSYITHGRLTARLTHVGEQSYAGRLVQSVRKVKVPRSRLMEDLKKLIRVISYFLLPMGLLLFLKQYRGMGDPLSQAVPATVAAVLGMIPEGLVLLTSMALAVGVIRLGRQGVLVQELYGIENLARVDTLCVDKTGTITCGMLRVQQVLMLPGAQEAEVDRGMAQMLAISGDDNLTMKALRAHWANQAVIAAGAMPSWVPFSPASKWSAVCSQGGCFILGAPESILRGDMPDVARQAAQYAADGLRVLLFASAAQAPAGGVLPPCITPLALVMLSDEMRAEFAPTARYLSEQGVTIKVVSGDNPLTVAQVAASAGLEGAREWVDAAGLHTGELLAAASARHTVFGRVLPGQKKLLVEALKAQGHVVAMMGDGVNDVPALKACDCAIAMAGGSDAAQKVSQLILLDKNFASLPPVILEGRRVINNITRSASLFLVKTLTSALLSLLLLVLPFSYPFHPIQLTLISSFTVGIPAFILALTPNRERVREGFMQTILTNAMPGALSNVLLLCALLFLSGPLGIGHAQMSAMATGVLAVNGLMVLYYTCRPLNRDRMLLLVGMTAGLILCVAFFGPFFMLSPLSGRAVWLMAALMGLVPFCLYAMRALVQALRPRLWAKGAGRAA